MELEHEILLQKMEIVFFLNKSTSSLKIKTDQNQSVFQTELVGILQQTEQSWDRNQDRNGVLFHLSSLEQVRDQFADRLADFHCLNKDIYEVYFLQACE